MTHGGPGRRVVIGLVVGLALAAPACRRGTPTPASRVAKVSCYQGYGRPDEVRQIPQQVEFRCAHDGVFTCPAPSCVLYFKLPRARYFRDTLETRRRNPRPTFLARQYVYKWEVGLSDAELERAVTSDIAELEQMERELEQELAKE